MSKGPKTTKVKQDVPKFVEDQIRLAFRRANEFQPDVYEGDRVAGFTPDQQRYMGDVRAYTSGPSQYASAVDAVNQIGSGQLGADTSGLAALANAGVDSSGIDNMIGRQNQAIGMMQNTDIGTTPYLERALSDAANQATDNYASMFARAGRLGSGAFGDSLGRGVTNALAPILQANLQQDANRRLQAAQSIGQFAGQDMARDLSAASQISQLAQADLARQAQIANQLAGYSQEGLAQRLNAARLAPVMQDMDVARMNLLGQIGDAQQGMAQAQLAAAAQQIADRNSALQTRLANIANATGLGNVTVGRTESVNDPGAFMQGLLGIGAGLASGGAFNPLLGRVFG